MIDFLIKDASVVDGSGGALYAADVAVSNGKITQIGRITDAARETINAQGAWLTPGFVDIHSHYDGQASWDETFSPSIQHGTTTVVLGNCGVGFAPLARNTQDEQQRLIRLMEGVEDIPGVALAEGVKFNWTDFPSYMNALDAMPHSLDYACLVPHDPLRMAVMGERALAQEAATVEDCAQMQTLLKQALKAGAAGFSTGRSDNHRTSRGEWTPASEAGDAELNALAAAFKDAQHGVIQLVNDFDVLRGATHEDDAAKLRFNAEFSRIKQMAQISARPLSMTWLQRDPGGIQWQWLAQAVEQCAAEGLPMYMQTAARGIGVITGLDTAFHALMGFPLYKEVAHLPLPERAAALRDPLRRARLLSEKSERLAGDGSSVPPLVDMLLARTGLDTARLQAEREAEEGNRVGAGGPHDRGSGAVELAGQLAVGQRGEVRVVPRVVPHRADPTEVRHERGVCRHEAPGHEEGRRHVLPAQSRKDRWRPAAVRSPVEGEGHDLGRGRQHRDDPGRSCRRRPTG